MKALSFIGTSGYQETTYVHQGQSCQTRFFPVALYALFAPDELVLFTTEQAREKHLDALAGELDDHEGWKWSTTLIPEGKSEEEIWRLFDVLVEQVHEGEEVLLDLTHGYRSLPLLAFIAAAYLRVAKGVGIRGILYGAWDARNAEGPTPVFDLSPFLSLLDWTAATDLFQRTGNAEPLAALLGSTQDDLYRLGSNTPDLPKRLKLAARALGGLSEAMRLVRVHEAMQLSADLVGRLAEAEAEAGRWAKPFAVLLDELQQGYAPFALTDPLAEPEQDLRVQLQLIRWYIDKGWGLEAVALAREWLISFAAYRLRPDRDMLADRGNTEHLLNSAADLLRYGIQLPEPAAGVPLTLQLAQTWNELRDLRNDLAHAGMRKQPLAANKVRGSIGEVHDKLSALTQGSVSS